MMLIIVLSKQKQWTRFTPDCQSLLPVYFPTISLLSEHEGNVDSLLHSSDLSIKAHFDTNPNFLLIANAAIHHR